MIGCPYLDNKASICYLGCKDARERGEWRACAGSEYDPAKEEKKRVVYIDGKWQEVNVQEEPAPGITQDVYRLGKGLVPAEKWTQPSTYCPGRECRVCPWARAIYENGACQYFA